MGLSLKPANLTDFTSLFHQKDFVLKRVVGTTYSLYYETLLMLILALIYGPGANDAIDKKTNEISSAALLAAIRKIKEENLLNVFCQADKANLAATGDERYLLTLLDAFVHPVPVKNDKGAFSSFHSKVWLVAFEKNDNHEEKAFRLIVTSRNLTSNQDFDAVAAFDSSENGSTAVVDAIREQVGQLPPEFDDARFNISPYSFLKAGKLNETSFRECHSIFSPFLDANMFDYLPSDHPVNVFSMGQEICKLGEKNIGNGNLRFFMLNPDMNANTETDGSDDGKHFGLHAKLYISDRAVILGSSNFTYRGLTQNREYNVNIHQGINEADLLKSVVGAKNTNESDADWRMRLLLEKSGMFLPYEPSAPVEEPSEAEKKLDKLLQELACCKLTAKYDDAGNLSLSVNYQPEAGVKMGWKPFLHGDDFLSIGKPLCWQGVSPEHVCRIFVCKVEIDGAAPRQFQMLADLDTTLLDELWDNRFKAEKSKVDIKDEIDFRMLCIEKKEDLYGRVVQLKMNEGDSASSSRGNRMPQPPIFERLLELEKSQLRDFFKDPPQKREDDSSGIYDAFVEMGRFFGFYQNKEQ